MNLRTTRRVVLKVLASNEWQIYKIRSLLVAAFEAIKASTERGEPVRIYGFGSFVVRTFRISLPLELT